MKEIKQWDMKAWLGKSGKDPAKGLPLRWMESLVKEVMRDVLDAEEATMLVFGMDKVTISWEHTLTKEEELAKQLSEATAKITQMQALIPPEGYEWSETALAKLEQLLKS